MGLGKLLSSGEAPTFRHVLQVAIRKGLTTVNSCLGQVRKYDVITLHFWLIKAGGLSCFKNNH